MKIAFVTPSYRGDLERCRLLCESTSRFLPDEIEHLLIIDRRDLEMFRPLENDRVRIVEAESLVPWWIFRVPGIQGWWASLRSMPIRNWIYQQLLKLSIAEATDAEVLQFVDSDVTLTRPFPVDYLVRDGRVRLQRVGYQDAEHGRWLQVAAQLLGVEEPIDPHFNYIGNMITWTRSNALEMLERIRRVNGTSHVRAVARRLQFSEYMTYGVFVDYVKGLEASGHFHDDSPNLHLCWGYDLSNQSGVDHFLSQIRPENFGIMIHSKLGVPIESYRPQLQELWSQTKSPELTSCER